MEPVIVRLTSFNDSSLTLRATVYSRDNSEGFAMLSDLRIAIKKRFWEGIEFHIRTVRLPYKKEVSMKVSSRNCNAESPAQAI